MLIRIPRPVDLVLELAKVDSGNSKRPENAVRVKEMLPFVGKASAVGVWRRFCIGGASIVVPIVCRGVSNTSYEFMDESSWMRHIRNSVSTAIRQKSSEGFQRPRWRDEFAVVDSVINLRIREDS